MSLLSRYQLPLNRTGRLQSKDGQVDMCPQLPLQPLTYCAEYFQDALSHKDKRRREETQQEGSWGEEHVDKW